MLSFPFFGPCCVICGILLPQSGIECRPSALKAWSPNHWTTKKFPKKCFLEDCEFKLTTTRRGSWEEPQVCSWLVRGTGDSLDLGLVSPAGRVQSVGSLHLWDLTPSPGGRCPRQHKRQDPRWHCRRACIRKAEGDSGQSGEHRRRTGFFLLR